MKSFAGTEVDLQTDEEKPQSALVWTLTIRLEPSPRLNRTMFLSVVATACIAGYFWFFAGGGLWADFTPDDLMNLYFSWRAPVSQHLRDILLFFRPSPTHRPMGSLFYRLLFGSFGFDALPFRVACYGLLVANLWLAYALVRRLTGSRQIAAIAALLHSYHGRFWAFYINTGVCYDLLCFFFYASAFLYYLRARERHFPLPWPRIAIWSCLYILCLNSKEMAVSLPAVIAVYELLRDPPGSRRLIEARSVPLIGGMLTALFIFGRTASPAGLPSMEAYRPVLRLDVGLDRARHLLGYALYEPGWLTPAAAGAIVLVMIVAAIRSGSLPLRLSLAWMLIGILPVAFISQRGLDAVYIPCLALALYLAVAIATAARRFPPRMVFASVLLALLVVHSRFDPIDFRTMTAQGRHIRSVYEQFRASRRVFPEGSWILFLRDPFPDADWNSAFLVYLYSQDRSLHVRNVERLLRDPDQVLDFPVVLTYEQDRLLECDARPFRDVSTRDLRDRVRSAACRVQ